MTKQEVLDALWICVPVRWYQAEVRFEVTDVRLGPEPTHAEVDIKRADNDPVTVEFSFEELANPSPSAVKSRLVSATSGE